MSGFRWTLAALLSHWRRRPVQFAALFAGLALATALWTGVQGLNAQARESYDRAAAMLGGGRFVTLARPEGGMVDEAVWARLRRLGWPVSPMVEGRTAVEGRGVTIVGVEPVSLAALDGGLPAAAGAAALIGAQARTLIAADTLADLGLAEGDAPRARGGSLPPLAVADGVAAGTLLLDIGPAQTALGAAGRISRLLAPEGFAVDAAALAASSDGRLAVVQDDAAGDLERLTASFHMNLTAFGLLAFAVGLFIAHAAAGLAFEQRLPTIRTLRACGVSRGTLAAALLAELAGLALLAGAVGVALGYLIAAALLPDVAATLRGLYGAPVSGSFAVAPAWWLSGLAMALAGALAAAGAGLWRAARMAPL
ncbi:MAG: FtsX-like permease family protein, partial [Rhodobacteraceae bacterium]